MVVGGGYDNDGNGRFLFPETLAELLNVLTRLLFAVNHNPVSSSLHIRQTAFDGVVNGLSCNQALATGNNHEVRCNLRPFSFPDLIAEILDGVLYLCCIGPQQRILLQSGLVLDNYSGNTQTL